MTWKNLPSFFDLLFEFINEMKEKYKEKLNRGKQKPYSRKFLKGLAERFLNSGALISTYLKITSLVQFISVLMGCESPSRVLYVDDIFISFRELLLIF